MIPFNKPYMTGKELWYIAQAHTAGHLAGDGVFTHRCSSWLEKTTGAGRALLTHSGTAALEMACILIDLKAGDEVILPSFTFVSTATAVVMRGATPVFVDINKDTLNIDVATIEQAITDKTKAIIVVHYAGVACDMDAIMNLASKKGLFVIEDAAHGIMADYKGSPLGSIGHLGCLSFHETKNIISGEGGALLVNDPSMIERAEIIREKGTNRSKYFRGHVDKYTWCDIGSSYLPAEITAAFLWAQIESADDITARRLDIWNTYHTHLEECEQAGYIRRPILNKRCKYNGHLYYILLQSGEKRDAFIRELKSLDIATVFHYVPLHSSPAGKIYARVSGSMDVTNAISERLVRLPLWIGVEEHMEVILSAIKKTLPMLS